MVVLAHWSKLREGDISPWEVRGLYVRQKVKVAKYTSLPPVEPHLLELPVRREELPVEFRSGEAGSLTADLVAMAHEVVQFVRQMPLRKDHRSLQGDGLGNGRGAVDSQTLLPLSAICQVVRACAGRLPQQEQRVRSEPPRAFPLQLMLEDGCEDFEERDRSPDKSGHADEAARASG